MNNQKAFTLIEILAVIVIIGVISLITVPVVTKVLKDTGDKIFESNTELLRIAAENYYKMDTTLLPRNVADKTIVLLDTLVKGGYTKEVKNPEDPSIVCKGYVVVEKTTATKYTYTPYLDCGEDMVTGGYYERAVVDRRGLVGYWKFDGDALDYSGNGNNGTIYGATWAPNRLGVTNKALRLDGVDDYVNCGNKPSLMPASISIVGWLKFSSTENTNWMLINKATGGTSGSYYIYGNNVSDNLWSIFGPGGERYNTSLPIFDKEKWYLVASTFDSITGEMKTYVNGELKNTTFGAALGYNTADVLLGRYTSDYYLDGYIDDIRVYNRVLSEAEMEHIYAIEKWATE